MIVVKSLVAGPVCAEVGEQLQQNSVIQLWCSQSTNIGFPIWKRLVWEVPLLPVKISRYFLQDFGCLSAQLPQSVRIAKWHGLDEVKEHH